MENGLLGVHEEKNCFFYNNGLNSSSIQWELAKEGIQASVPGILKFVRNYEQRGTISRKPGSERPGKLTPAVQAIIDQQMQRDDETTATQLQKLLTTQGYSLSLRTIQRSRVKCGWTFRESAYCQIIREQNKLKLVEWAKLNLEAALHSEFNDVVWTDETSIQLESHRRHSFRKRGCLPKPKPRCRRFGCANNLLM